MMFKLGLNSDEEDIKHKENLINQALKENQKTYKLYYGNRSGTCIHTNDGFIFADRVEIIKSTGELEINTYSSKVHTSSFLLCGDIKSYYECVVVQETDDTWMISIEVKEDEE